MCLHFVYVCDVTRAQVAVKTLPFYNKYFNIAYPLPKIDLIAISDFSAGTVRTCTSTAL